MITQCIASSDDGVKVDDELLMVAGPSSSHEVTDAVKDCKFFSTNVQNIF